MEWILSHLIIVIAGGWAIGMGGYIWLNKYDKYNNIKFYDVKANVKKFKHITDEINGVEKKSFK